MSVIPGTARRPSPLPLELTPLFGRERECEQLRGMLATPGTRLVTITGPGGVGKTRLALHVASTIAEDDDDSVAYLTLASIRDAALVLPEIAQSFGVFSAAQDAAEDQLVAVLEDRQILLVLDNMEQVLGAAPELANVLARCPGVTMLVTSQAPLAIPGEQLYPLAPLPLPTSPQAPTEEILRSDAVSLFIQRARSVNPNLRVDDRAAGTIAEICRRLDGLPLAIELAAARTSILSPEALLARLSNRLQVLGGERRGVPDRLRTMRNAIAWSYDLLSADEQVLFRQLAVFAGGFSLDAVEAMVAARELDRDPLDVLGALVNHSLLQPDPAPSDEARFLMLETLRDFGLEQLDETGEANAAYLTHATWFVDLAERAEPALIGSEQETWINRLDLETDNLRAATEWALASGHPELALRIGGAIWRFCSIRGLASDCLSWLQRAFAATPPDSPWRIRGLIGAGNMAEDLRQLDQAQALFEETVARSRAAGDLLGETRGLTGVGIVAHDRGDYATARAHHEQALEVARRSGDPRSIAVASGNMAGLSYFQGELDAAERYWEECLAITERLGDVTSEALTAGNLGALAYERGDLQRAEELQRRALGLQRQMRSSRDLPFTLVNLGEIACLLGDYTQSHDCFAEAIALLREDGNEAIEGVALNGAAKLAMAQGEPTRAAALLVDSTKLLADHDNPFALIENADVTAALCGDRGNHAGVAEMLAAADRARRELDTEPTPQKRSQMEPIETAARAALSRAAWDRAWEAGQALDIPAMTRRIETLAREIVGRRQPSIEPSEVAPEAEPTGQAESILTARETEVLRLLVQGKSTREVSDALFISPRTTSTHITNILGKLGVSTRTAAVALAMREGLV